MPDSGVGAARRSGKEALATLKQCRAAVKSLVRSLDGVHPELRAKHVPKRSIACHLSDLDVTFVGRLDENGLHDLQESADKAPEVDVRLTMVSDQLIALAEGTDDFLPAWVRGRVQVSASVRDLLRLRSLFGI